MPSLRGEGVRPRGSPFESRKVSGFCADGRLGYGSVRRRLREVLRLRYRFAFRMTAKVASGAGWRMVDHRDLSCERWDRPALPPQVLSPAGLRTTLSRCWWLWVSPGP